MNKQDLTIFLESFGWFRIHSNNPCMISFLQEEKLGRLNYYFTTGTVTVQNPTGGIATKREATLDNVEDMIRL